MSSELALLESVELKKAEDVVLPAEAIAGFNSAQISLSKECSVKVRFNLAVAGAAVYSTCKELSTLKNLLGRGNWMQFIKGGGLPVSAKQAQDLANAYDKWLKNAELSDGDLLGIGTRALNKLANAGSEAQEAATKMLQAGKRITEATASKIIDEVNGVESISKETKAKIKTSLTAQAKVVKLEDEVAKLKQKIQSLQSENIRLKKMANKKVEAVMKNMRFKQVMQDSIEQAIEAQEEEVLNLA